MTMLELFNLALLVLLWLAVAAATCGVLYVWGQMIKGLNKWIAGLYYEWWIARIDAQHRMRER